MRRTEKYQEVEMAEDLYESAIDLLDRAESAFEEDEVETIPQIAEETQQYLKHKGLSDPEVRVEMHFLLADCLFEMGDVPAAIEQYTEIRSLDPDNDTLDYFEARARFHQWDFATAERLLDEIDLIPETKSAISYYQGLLLEWHGDLEKADRCFRKAALDDHHSYRAPCRVPKAAVQAQLEQTLSQLPDDARADLFEVDIRVEDLPEASRYKALATDPLMLSFSHHPLREDECARPEIVLFQRNLERIAEDRGHLLEEVRTTLLYELGEYLGRDVS